MNSTTKRVARKAMLRALPLCRTIWAARSSVSSTRWARSPAAKRSTPSGAGPRGAGGDFGRVDGQHAVRADAGGEPVEAAQGGPEALRLDAQTVIARAVAGALEPVVLGAEVRLAAEVRAALVERAHVEVRALAVGARAGHEAARRVDEQDVRARRLEVGRGAVAERGAQRGRRGVDLLARAPP